MALTLASNAITFTDNTSLSSGIITNAQLSANSVGVLQLSGGAVQQSFANTSGAFNFRNKFINGNFDIWQRGTSGFTNLVNGYCADRWAYNYNTTDTVTFSRQLFTPGQTDVPGNPTYFIRATITGGNTDGVNDFRQRVEGVRTLAGKTVTISYWIRGSIPATISGGHARIIQFFGSGGSPSDVVQVFFGTAIPVTTSWQKVIRTITLPSITGKIIGTNNNDYIDVILGLPIRTTMTVDIAQVQLEEGSVATPFEQRPIGLELSLCQRYYCRVRSDLQVPQPGATVGTMYFPVTMRVAPTFNVITEGNSGGTITSAPVAGPSDTGTYAQIVGSTSGAFRVGKIVEFDAEI